MKQYVVSDLGMTLLKAAVKQWYIDALPHSRPYDDPQTGEMVPPREMPSWVRAIVTVVRDSTCESFDYMSGQWSPN